MWQLVASPNELLCWWCMTSQIRVLSTFHSKHSCLPASSLRILNYLMGIVICGIYMCDSHNWIYPRWWCTCTCMHHIAYTSRSAFITPWRFAMSLQTLSCLPHIIHSNLTFICVHMSVSCWPNYMYTITGVGLPRPVAKTQLHSIYTALGQIRMCICWMLLSNRHVWGASNLFCISICIDMYMYMHVYSAQVMKCPHWRVSWLLEC